MDPSRTRGEAGFTLIEAMVSMLILVVGLIAITNLFIVAASSNSVANHGTAAAALASETVEQIKAIPFTDLVAGGDLDNDAGAIANCDADTNDNCVSGLPAPNFNLARNIAGVGRIKVRWTITNPGAGGPDTLFIRVRAESLAPLAGPRSRAEFTTFRACTAASPPCP